ncbi:putative transposase [Granulicella rosea]|uniref:Putative transposase n=1 Tax=Granulicella rosea TaxID=474952 RepID=A0A239DYL1_9BACT|nr:transposase [Granulicella rosea]SNS36813.1 putative transposase [Granulicella rosea]
MPLAPQEIRTFFVTSVTASRRRLFQVEQNALLLMNVMQENRAKGRFRLHAFVIMPDHIHLILTPAVDVPLEKALQYIKGGFSFRLKSKLEVWEKSFAEHRIKDAMDYRHHSNYLERNPVRKRLAERAEEFPFSSARHCDQVDDAPAHLAFKPQG